MTEFDWNTAASRLLKSELAREGLTHARLAARLQGLGLKETEASVKSKLHRGTFSAAFLMQCLVALDRATLVVTEVVPGQMPWGRGLERPVVGDVPGE